jgi:hypothetical protein
MAQQVSLSQQWSAAHHLTVDWACAAIATLCLIPSLIALIPSAGLFPLLLAVLLVVAALAAIVVFFPIFEIHSPHSPSVFAAIWGVISVAAAVWEVLAAMGCYGFSCTPHPADAARSAAASAGSVPVSSLKASLPVAIHVWMIFSAAALTVLVISGFIFEMARRERIHLIASLSLICLAGVSAWGMSGWIFTPFFIVVGPRNIGWILIVCALVIGLLVAACFQVFVSEFRFGIAKAIDSHHEGKDAADLVARMSPRGVSLCAALCAAGVSGIAVPVLLTFLC